MKTLGLTMTALLIYMAAMSQESRNKKLLIGLNTMFQRVAQNYTPNDIPYFEDTNYNLDVHIKIGGYLFQEKVLTGLGFNVRTVNEVRTVRAEEFDPEIDYIRTIEFQFGIFLRYRIIDELFIETYAGLIASNLNYVVLPNRPKGPIIKYKIEWDTHSIFGTF